MRKRPDDDKQGERHAPSRRDPGHQQDDPVVRIQDTGERPCDSGARWVSSDRDIQDRYSSR
jgi:hypothetical protein